MLSVNFIPSFSFKSNINNPVSKKIFNSYNKDEFIKNTDGISFKGTRTTSTLQPVDNGENYSDLCIHETYFFRDIDTLNFTVNYLKDNYPQGANIAEFAASTGEEAYSLAMLLNSANKDKRYTITGYDIVPSLLNSRKNHLYEITSGSVETFLHYQDNVHYKKNPELKRLFDDFFTPIPRDWYFVENIDRELIKTIKSLKKTKDEDEIKKLKYYLQYLSISVQDRYNAYYIPKKDAFNNVVSFKTGDICDLGTKLDLPDNSPVIFFKNALYHIISFSPKEGDDFSAAKNLITQINKKLPIGGLFVMGALPADHMYENNKHDYSKDLKTIVQDGKIISVYDESRVHNILRNKGFEPVFYQQEFDVMGDPIKNGNYLPSVWKKVRDVDS